MADTDSSPSDRLSVSTGGGVLDVKICRIVQNIIFLCFVCCLLPEHLHGYGTQWRRRKERSWPTRSLSEDRTWWGKFYLVKKRLVFICWEKIYFAAWIDLLFIFASTFATTSPRNQSIKFRDRPHYGSDATGALSKYGITKREKWSRGCDHGNIISEMNEMQEVWQQPNLVKFWKLVDSISFLKSTQKMLRCWLAS